jgi:hypothetical protein
MFSLRINLNMTAIKDGAIIIGTSIKENRTRFPGKIRSNKSANENPRMSSMTVAVKAKTNVKRIEPQKFGSVRILLKFSKPAG